MTYNGVTPPSSCSITTPTIVRANYIILGWAASASAPTSFTAVDSTLWLSSNVTYYAITGWDASRMCTITSATTDSYDSSRCLFKGADPNNYVRFNNTNYRIIAATNGKIKIVNMASTLSTTTSYTYSNGAAYTLLNSGSYYSGLSSSALDLIESTTFNTGIVTYYSDSNKYIGNAVADEPTITGTYMTGLPTVSEFLRASSNSGCTSTTSWQTFNMNMSTYSGTGNCTRDNWMYIGNGMHFINPHTTNRIKYMASGSRIIRYDTSSISAIVYPVHGFKSNVVFISGTGTSSDPYIPYISNEFSCTVTTSSDYDTSKTLTINSTSINGITYSWDNTTFNATRTKVISSAGTFTGYVRGSGGLTYSCSIVIASRTEYRTASCTPNWGDWITGSPTCCAYRGDGTCESYLPYTKAYSELHGLSYYYTCGSDSQCAYETGYAGSCIRYNRTCSSVNCGSWSAWTTEAAGALCERLVETRTTYAPIN